MTDITYTIHDYAGEAGNDKTVTVSDIYNPTIRALWRYLTDEPTPYRIEEIGVTIVAIEETDQ